MGRRPCARSPHFSAHYLGELELSTGAGPGDGGVVDDPREDAAPKALRLGMVVPKRHARRSVTRSLLKRQIRARVRDRLVDLPPGAWVFRLRAPFDRQQFPSAASVALAEVVRAELEGLLADALRRTGRAGRTAVAGPLSGPTGSAR